MATATIKDIQELPAVLTMKDIQAVLGISKPKTYELAHTRGFPVVKFGKALRVPHDSFLRWLNAQEAQEE